jgi:hypothetical protein
VQYGHRALEFVTIRRQVRVGHILREITREQQTKPRKKKKKGTEQWGSPDESHHLPSPDPLRAQSRNRLHRHRTHRPSVTVRSIHGYPPQRQNGYYREPLRHNSALDRFFFFLRGELFTRDLATTSGWWLPRRGAAHHCISQRSQASHAGESPGKSGQSWPSCRTRATLIRKRADERVVRYRR